MSESGSRQMTHSSWYEESSLDGGEGAPPFFFSSSFDMVAMQCWLWPYCLQRLSD